jgi:hypothetical protein
MLLPLLAVLALTCARLLGLLWQCLMRGLMHRVCVGISISRWHSWPMCSCRACPCRLQLRTSLGALLCCLLLRLLLLLLAGIRHAARVCKAVCRGDAVQQQRLAGIDCLQGIALQPVDPDVADWQPCTLRKEFHALLSHYCGLILVRVVMQQSMRVSQAGATTQCSTCSSHSRSSCAASAALSSAPSQSADKLNSGRVEAG